MNNKEGKQAGIQKENRRETRGHGDQQEGRQREEGERADFSSAGTEPGKQQ